VNAVDEISDVEHNVARAGDEDVHICEADIGCLSDSLGIHEAS
jgi:hypothetical protein